MSAGQTFLYRLLALAAIIIWGLSFIATKALYAAGLEPWAVLTLRVVLSYAILLILSPKRLFADTLSDELRLMLLGVLCVPVYYGLENLALDATQAGTVAALMATAPLLTALIVLIRWRSFQLHWMMKLGMAASATGVFLVLFDSQVMLGLPSAGAWLSAGAACAWALYSALLKTLHAYDARFVARKAFGWGLIALLPFLAAEGLPDVSLLTDTETLLLLLFLAAGPTTLCVVLWNAAAVKAGNVNTWLYWVPIVTVIAGMTCLDESMSFVGWMGLVIILCGVWSAETGMKRVSAVLAGADPRKLSAKITFD